MKDTAPKELDSREFLYLFVRHYKVMLIVFIILMGLGIAFIQYQDTQNQKSHTQKTKQADHYLFSIQSKSLMIPLGDTRALLSNRVITQNLNLLKQNIKQTQVDSQAIQSIQNMEVTIPPSPQTPDIFWINIEAKDKALAQKYADMITWYIQNSPQSASIKAYLKGIYDAYNQKTPSNKQADFALLESQIQEILKNGVVIASELSKKQDGDIEDMVVWTNVSSQLTQTKMWIFLVISAVMIAIFAAFVADFFSHYSRKH
ncbi:hypothetical protein BKH46_01925 [Helicobacter sp. 12S02634-8]|uniref:hypothetical protein n=1 Tax=Helicobacter sp. 12S02634-8 TaxID=1476199 RepID=UPI000BA579C8|nr:hypothetical protein [Helicobacter sp. 12S02634-8]PAF48093.1 hypothetical protein BKH46_01925 [Helicobacter sp. 12S02634-8]